MRLFARTGVVRSGPRIVIPVSEWPIVRVVVCFLPHRVFMSSCSNRQRPAVVL